MTDSAKTVPLADESGVRVFTKGEDRCFFCFGPMPCQAHTLPAPKSGGTVTITRIDRAEDNRRRSARKREQRAVTEQLQRLPNHERRRLQMLYPQAELDANQAERPKRRADCIVGHRPCPWVGCRHNLYLDVSRAGNLTLNFPDVEPEDMAPDRSCALDVADGGGATLERVGELMNITRERVRQYEEGMLDRMHGEALALASDLLDAYTPDPVYMPPKDRGGMVPIIYATPLDAFASLSKQLEETPLPEKEPPK